MAWFQSNALESLVSSDNLVHERLARSCQTILECFALLILWTTATLVRCFWHCARQKIEEKWPVRCWGYAGHPRSRLRCSRIAKFALLIIGIMLCVQLRSEEMWSTRPWESMRIGNRPPSPEVSTIDVPYTVQCLIICAPVLAKNGQICILSSAYCFVFLAVLQSNFSHWDAQSHNYISHRYLHDYCISFTCRQHTMLRVVSSL